MTSPYSTGVVGEKNEATILDPSPTETFPHQDLVVDFYGPLAEHWELPPQYQQVHQSLTNLRWGEAP